MRTPPGLYAPPLEDVQRIAGVYARAMFRDPLNVFFFPHPRRRRLALAALYETIARVGLRSRMLHATSASMEGVALWDLPGEEGFTAQALIRSGALGFVWRAGLSRAAGMGRYEAWAHTLMRRHAPRGAAHLLLLAVDPDQQGKGWASRLLRPVLGSLDAEGRASCLETQNPANVPVYEHLGFAVTAHARVPFTDVGHWVMVRFAHGSSP